MIRKRKNLPPTLAELYILERITIDCNGCWLWSGALQTQGYGCAWANGVTVRAHRLSYETFVGPIPDGQLVLHDCDVRRCVNPDHLFCGDNKANSDDAVAKNRQARGSRQGLSKLTPEQVTSIRRDSRSGPAIARDYGVSKRTIQAVKNRETWSHVATT